MLVPMRSRTAKPFHTTNLVVMVPHNSINKPEGLDIITYGDALLMDPGCCTQSHSEVCTFALIQIYNVFYIRRFQGIFKWN